jgi:uncharacterized protein YxjI
VTPEGITLACPCGEIYDLRPEYAGVLLECPACARHLRSAARQDGGVHVPTPGVDPAFDRDVFLLRQRIFTIASKYEVLGEDGAPILYVERPTYPLRTLLAYVLGFFGAAFVFAFVASRGTSEAAQVVLSVVGGLLGVAAFVVVSMSARPLRHVTIYRDDSRSETLLRVLQDQRIAVIVRSYTITTGDGTVLARLAKNYLYNAIRKRWDVESPGGELVAIAVEESILLSLLRRVLGPLFGLLRTNFVFERPTGEELGEFNRTFTLFDRYVLDLRPDHARTFDRRLALALGVMLDTGERR